MLMGIGEKFLRHSEKIHDSGRRQGNGEGSEWWLGKLDGRRLMIPKELITTLKPGTMTSKSGRIEDDNEIQLQRASNVPKE